MLSAELEAAGVEFIDENGGGAGVAFASPKIPCARIDNSQSFSLVQTSKFRWKTAFAARWFCCFRYCLADPNSANPAIQKVNP
jgi:hypothetical protein